MFEVSWEQDTLPDLARLWIGADSVGRLKITKAAHDIDKLLANDPEEQGESREGNLRVMFSAPLAVKYTVDRASGKVRIFHLWKFD